MTDNTALSRPLRQSGTQALSPAKRDRNRVNARLGIIHEKCRVIFINLFQKWVAFCALMCYNKKGLLYV